MRYTVIGLINNQSDTLTIAGVLEGDHYRFVDTNTGPETAQRYADVFEADSPDAAEQEALATWNAED